MSNRVMYLRDKNNNPFGVLAVKLDCDNNRILYSVSVCHASDTFNKAKGIKIAQSLLENNPQRVEFVRVDGLSAHEITRHVMYDILQRSEVRGVDLFGTFTLHKGVPTKARKFAKAWLKGYNQRGHLALPESARLDLGRDGTNREGL